MSGEETTQRRPARLSARDVMSAPVITIDPQASVKEAAERLITHHISGMPVLTADGQLVGIVTEADLLHKESGPQGGGLLAFVRGSGEARKAEGLVVADVMTARVVTVTEETPVREIARLMTRHKINRVPVVRDGRVVGIVSRADVLRALARPDAEIADAVADVLLRELWIDTSKIRVEVDQGVVRLSGEVDRYSDKELAERWVAALDGVVAVDSRLTYRYDDRSARLGDRWPPPRP
ncbi:MAG: CBS domain-containing protein [Armatimonadota bacterium]|nr:CBS domain-containing protein [Armatimonadota bacterium]MDR5697544.1 CBS domain-containing protein [Armatimonadota bacterium]